MSNFVLGDQPTKTAFPWVSEYLITQGYGQNGEVGVDIATPFHTPITSLVDGTVLATGYPRGVGGIVSVATNIDRQWASWYVQHLDVITVQDQQRVKRGDLLGYSGGQLSGGQHPAAFPNSTGPHTETGINPPHGGLANPEHWGPSIDPVPWLASVIQGGVSMPAPLQGFSVNVVTKLTTQAGFLPIAQALDDAETFTPISASINPLDSDNLFASMAHNIEPFFVRSIIVLLGFMVLLAVIFWYLGQHKQGVEAAAGVAALAL